MICTSVIPCLSSGLAKNNKIMSMFVLFFWLFLAFCKFGFFSKIGDRPYTKTVKKNVLSQFFMGIKIK